MRPIPIRLFASAFTIFLFIRYVQSVISSPTNDFIILLMLIGYLVFIWGRRREWTIGKYIGLSVFMICGMLFLHCRLHSLDPGVGGGEITSTLIWPLVWLLASTPQQRLLSSSVLALGALAAILTVNLSSPEPYDQLLGPIALYFWVRGITSFKESHQVSKQHLDELREAHFLLQKAHHDLQEATVQSMHYAALSERTRLARDIHDGIGHHLTSLIVQLQALELMLPEQPEKAAEQVPIMLSVARKAMGEVRFAVRDWNEDDSGLGLIALKGLIGQCAAQTSIRFHFECDEERLPELPLDTCTTLYRVLQEALTNMIKHSGATSGCVFLEEKDQRIILTVSDDGMYTEDIPLTPDFGMIGMKTRCEERGGSFSYAVNPPHGMIIRADIPFRREAEE